MILKDLLLRLKKTLPRRRAAVFSVKVRFMLKFIGVNLSEHTEIQYLELGFFKSKILTKKMICKAESIRFKGYDASIEHNFGTKYQIEISNVLVNSENGLVYAIDDNGRYHAISESSDWPIHHVLLTSEKPPKNTIAKVKQATLGLPNSSFAHLIAEDLPALLISKSKYKYLFFRNSSLINQQIFGFYQFDKIVVPKWVHVDRLWMITRNSDVGYMNPRSVDLLRDSNKQVISTKVSKKYFISRLNSTRSLPEEILMQSIFSEIGFEIIYPEKMSFHEQREIFYNARMVAGIHGGGLVNTVWSNKCTVIELMPLDRINRCFEWQSLLLGHIYKRIYFDRNALSLKFIHEQISSLNLDS
jgi:hypothetical protein